MHKVIWILGSVIILAGIISPLSVVICGVLGLILIVAFNIEETSVSKFYSLL